MRGIAIHLSDTTVEISCINCASINLSGIKKGGERSPRRLGLTTGRAKTDYIIRAKNAE